jgi:hypothetical protein
MNPTVARSTAHALTKYYGPDVEEQIERIARVRKAGEDFITALLVEGTPGADLSAAVRHARYALQGTIASIVVPAVALPTGR